MTSARFLIDDDKRDPAEVRRVIDRVVANRSQWQHIDTLFMVKKHYAEILADLWATAPREGGTAREARRISGRPPLAGHRAEHRCRRCWRHDLVPQLHARLERPQPTPLTPEEVAEIHRARPEEKAAIVRRHLERDRRFTRSPALCGGGALSATITVVRPT